MTTPSTSSPSYVNVEHRGWTLQASWFHSFCGTTEGWVCFATRPSSCHKLNIGRWSSSDLALEQGRAYVDRRVDAPAQSAAKPGIQKRRP